MHYWLRGLVAVLSSLALVTNMWAVPDLWVLYEDYASTFQWSQSKDEAETLCAPHLSNLSSSFVLNKWKLQQELSFSLGDWQQQSSPFVAPLIPFDIPHQSAARTPSVHLSSLQITQLEMNYHRPINYVKADLHLLITSGPAHWKQHAPADFQMQPGFTSLKIALEGFYTKPRYKNRVLCMLGSAIPIHGAHASAPSKRLDSVNSNSESTGPPSSPDSNILAVFHFPDFPSLTTLAVIGKLSSLHAPSHPSYFSSINILAQLGPSAEYHFGSNDLVASACSSSQHPLTAIELPSNFHYGGYGSLCKLIQELFVNPWTLMPNPNCHLSQNVCSKLGPFPFKISSSTVMGGAYDGIQITLQHIRCEEIKEKDGSYTANVSAVFRALLPSENRSLASIRSGLDGMTLAAEGKWSSSSSTFCMVGCRGGYPSSDPSKEATCGSMVSIMFTWPGLSLTQRSLLRGSISSILSESDQFLDLSFYQPVFPSSLPGGLIEKLAYNYTQITHATALSEAHKKFRFVEKMKNSLCTYPFANGELSDLFDYLTISPTTVPSQISAEPLDGRTVKIQIVAVEDLVGSAWKQQSRSKGIESASGKVADEHKPYYRVAATLVLERSRPQKDDSFSVSVEGVYDSTNGMMSMIGCRVVSATWAVLQMAAGLLEDGLDCHILVRIQYPPTTCVHPFISPTLKLSVISNRTQDDPFFFPAIDLIVSIPIMYRKQRGAFMPHRSAEGGFSVLILSLMLGCIAGQLLHMKRHADSSPYISIFMLAIPAVSLSLSLIADMGALFGSNVKGGQVMDFKALQYVIKLLSLILTLRILQKVIESRRFLGTQPPRKSLTSPSEKKVMVVCTVLYGMLLITMCIDFNKTHQQYLADDPEKVLLKFYGVVQGLFLLPQVVGNHLWQVKGKPLSMSFYVGITVLTLLPHAYDASVPPDQFDPYSKARIVAIMTVLAVLLAIVLYFQQRGYRLRWDTVGLKTYPRLPPSILEAE